MSKYDSQAKRLMATEDRLMAGVDILTSGCWEWTGCVTQHGYGRISYQGHVTRAHRLAAHVWLGLDLADDSVKVCHTCDNPPCINPEHLYLGSQATNNADMVARGRNYPGPQRWRACSRGHDLTVPGATVGKKKPRCKVCNNEGQTRRRATIRAIEEAMEAGA